MTTSIIVVGINQWEEYTRPFLDSLREHEPDVRCVVVDNGSGEPYRVEKHNVIHARLADTVCYAKALNYGAGASGDSDWYMFFNNDVLVDKPFIHRIDQLDPKALYGFKIHVFVNQPYICGWCMIVSREAWEAVGKFDEKLTPMWYEDTDYCIRARKLGYKIQELDREEWGLRHLEDERQVDRKQYLGKHKDARKRNRKYMKDKHDI